MFVLYVAAGGGMKLVGLDSHTGKTRWQIAASPGAINPGVAPQLTVADHLVIYLKRTSGQTAKLIGANPRTGADVWASPAGKFTSWPEQCPGDPRDVCSTGSLSGHQTLLLRFAAATGAALPSPTIASTSSGRELAPGLFDPTERNPETLRSASGASVAWTRPLANVVTAPGLSTDYGWNFDRINQIGLFVGSVAGSPVSQTASQVVFDLTKTVTVGIHIGDGSVAWEDQHSSYLCTIVACPGSASPGSSGAGAGDSPGPTVGLRLRATGTLSGSPTAAAPSASAGATAVLEGFDPTTGHTLWSFAAAADTGLLAFTTLPPRLANATLVLKNKAGEPTSVDLTNGTQQTIPAGTVAWCQSPTTYQESVPFQPVKGTAISQYTGAFATFPCDTTQAAVRTPDAVLGFVGPASGGVVAWSQADKVIAAPLKG